MENNSIDWLKVARLALLSRRLDDLEVEKLTPQGKIKYQFSAGGHELAQILLAQTLNHPYDGAAIYYRSRPFVLASGLTITEAIAGGLAVCGSPTEGREVGVMFNLPNRGGPTVFPASGDVGSQYTPAAGWAQAITYHRKVLKEADWDSAVAVAMGGDGSVASNGFWATLNIITTLQLPVLLFIEDNNYGISVPSHLQTPGGDIAANLACYQNLKIASADGTDPAEAWQAIWDAVQYVRSGEGPFLLRMQVARLRGHTFIDDQAYKSDEERRAEEASDPLYKLQNYLVAQEIASETTWKQLEKDVQQELSQALHKAETAGEPDPSQARRHIFFEGEAPLQGGLRPRDALIPLGDPTPHPGGPRINFVDAVRRTMESEMERNPRMLVFGEDVGVKGGVHGATLDMQRHFGADRVFDTSLSEEGIIGRAVGMALAGLLPVPEIQFRKYADPAHEQLSDLGTIRWRSANRFAAPVVVRMPVGFGKKIGDPWHSVNGEAIYAHLPGWRIAFPSNAEDAAGLLRTALRGDDPTFFFEHRALLDTPSGRRPYPGDDFCLPYGKAARITEGDELTVITWGAMVHRCLKAAEDFAGRVQILDLRTIIPWDRVTVLESVRKTGKALVVHEDTLTAGFGGEIVAVIASQAFTDLDAPVERLGTLDIPTPYNASLMDAVVPTVEVIHEKMEWLLGY